MTTSEGAEGGCHGCGGILTGKQRRWCGAACQKKASREARLIKCFNINLSAYDKIFVYQGGVCAICGRPPKAGKSLAVDHDHKTGYVRGLLCFMCNKRVLGARSAEILVKTAAYVMDPPAFLALGENVVAPGRPRKKRQPRKRKR